jgi:hypothetical protein
MSLMPYLGTGIMFMPCRRYEVILKEEGTNVQYYAGYSWGTGDGDLSLNSWGRNDMLGYVTARVNFRYKISPRQSLLAGLEYTYVYDTINFRSWFEEPYNSNIVREERIKGRRMNMLGISVGISFM